MADAVTVIDHLVLGVPDLDQGVATLAALTGVTSAIGGSHAGLGTRNALMSLGERMFLELLAPDPAQSLEGTEGGWIAALPGPRLLTFGVRTSDLDGIHAVLTQKGFDTPPRTLERTRPDGVVVRFSELILGPFLWGHSLPFWIDWYDSPHPGQTSPGGCTFEALRVLSPEADTLAETYRQLGLTVPVERATAPGFLARLSTPNGPLWLTG